MLLNDINNLAHHSCLGGYPCSVVCVVLVVGGIEVSVWCILSKIAVEPHSYLAILIESYHIVIDEDRTLKAENDAITDQSLLENVQPLFL